MYERLCRMEKYYEVSKTLGIVTGGPPPLLDDPEDKKRLLATVGEFHPEVLVIDPLYRFHTADENSATEMRHVLDSLDRLTDAYGVATIVLHHTNKNGEDTASLSGSADRLRGSTAIPGWATSILMMMGNPMTHITIMPTLRGLPSSGFELELDEEMGIFRLRGAKLDGVVLSHLKEQGGEVPMPDLKKWLAEVQGKDDKTAERYIKGMQHRGLIRVEPLDGRTKVVRLSQPV